MGTLVDVFPNPGWFTSMAEGSQGAADRDC